jgi:hypothetical protein
MSLLSFCRSLLAGDSVGRVSRPRRGGNFVGAPLAGARGRRQATPLPSNQSAP